MTTISVKTAIIAPGNSMSDVLDLTGATAVVGVVMPTTPNLIPTVVTLQGSPDGINFYDIHDGTAGVELRFNAKLSTLVMINPNRLRCCKAIIIRSGTYDAPVVQTAVCHFGVVCES